MSGTGEFKTIVLMKKEILIVKNITHEDQDLLQLDAGQLRTHFEAIRDEYTQVGRQLFKNFLRIINFL